MRFSSNSVYKFFTKEVAEQART